MVVKGKEINFKISNKNHARNFEEALKGMEKAEKEIKSKTVDTTKMSVVVDYVIEMFRDFFVKAPGEDVLADCEDMDEAKEAYYEFLAGIKKQKEAFLQPFSLDRVK